MKNIRVQELEDRDSGLFITPLAQVGHAMNPLFVSKLFLGYSFRDIEKLLRDEPFELTERLAFEDARHLLPFPCQTFPQNKLAEFLEKGRGRIQNFPLEFFSPLS